MVDLSQLTPGLTGTADLLVGSQHTAPSIGSGLVPVLGTPVMINVIEAAALAAVERLLPTGHQSLGIHLDVRHFAGQRLNCAARHKSRSALDMRGQIGQRYQLDANTPMRLIEIRNKV